MRRNSAVAVILIGSLVGGCDTSIVGAYIPKGKAFFDKITLTSGGYVDVTFVGVPRPAASKYVTDGNRIIIAGEDGGRIVFLVDGQGCIVGEAFVGTYCKTSGVAASPQQGVPPSPGEVEGKALSKVFESTLGYLQAQPHQEVPRSQYTSPHDSATGGSLPDEKNARLSAATRGAIGDHLRECWTGDKGALDRDRRTVRLIVTIDAGGTIRKADVSANDASRSGDSAARAFAERARRAVLDPGCAQLPLPSALKGLGYTFDIFLRP